MKPAPFDYVRPETLAEACALLAGDEDARVIAGGQTLVPMLAMRLARPARLIDILRLPELAGIREEDGAVIVGATTRQAQAERDPVIRASVPMLARVLPWVGHPPTRNRGTVGGSIANADPSAEIPLVAVTLGAEILLATPDGPASMPSDDFFIGPMLTTIGQGECVQRDPLSGLAAPAHRHGLFRDQRAQVGFCLRRGRGTGRARRGGPLPRSRARRRRCRRPAVAARCILARSAPGWMPRRYPTRSTPHPASSTR